MNVEVYAAYYDNPVRKLSSSGGVFSLLAKEFDVVYGVAMSTDCYEAVFVRTEQDISALRGSKYLQAKVGDTYKKVKADLIEGKEVLFTGTPCQINGLKLFLSKEYDNLMCVDVICHGVPSPALWKKYVTYMETLHGKKVAAINFRAKDCGWKNFGIKKDEKFVSKDEDAYMQMFLRDYCLRPSCYNCKAKENKLSDMTIADFWGIEEVAPEMDDGKGTSLVLVRTEKGKACFEKIYNELKYKLVNYSEAVKNNPSEYQSVKRPIQREDFFMDMNNMRFDELQKKYIPANNSFKDRIKKIIKRIIGYPWKNRGVRYKNRI